MTAVTTVADQVPTEKTNATGNAESTRQLEVRKHLQPFNQLIGNWRGVGQTRRGSVQGTWQERIAFEWKYGKHTATIECTTQDGKHFTRASLSWDPDNKHYLLLASLPDGSTRKYTGRFLKDVIQLESEADDKNIVHSLTLRFLSERRILIFHEQRKQTQSITTRQSEVGYTKEGTRLAASDQTGPECVVSGGAGTIKVSYKGSSWYVCCTGCKDAFDADPEKVLAEYQSRKHTVR